MIQFIYGENRYLVSQTLKKVESEFAVRDPSTINVDKVEGADLTVPKFVQVVSAMPFLADARLVIIKNLMLENGNSNIKSTIAEKLPLIDSKALELVFVEMGEPDKRTKLYKYLIKEAKCIFCEELRGANYSNWVGAEFKKRGIDIDNAALDKFVIECGSNMQKALNEIKKITLYIRSQKRKAATSDDISIMVSRENNPDIFEFIEAIAQKNGKKALQMWFNFIQNGESEHRILSMVVYQFRTMLIVREALDRNINIKELASLAKLHPFVVQKTAALVSKKRLRQLVMIYDQLRRTESIIKSGSLQPELAADIMISTLCK